MGRQLGPRLVVSVTASADGRVALGRTSVLIEEAAGSVWRSLHPAGADTVIAERQALLESRYHPEAVLEGSGTFVTELGDAPSELPAADLDAGALLEPYLPGGTDCRWFVVVDGRGRIRWTHKGDGSRRLLVLTCDTTPAEYLGYLRREQIPYLVTGSGRVDLAAALHMLKELLGVTCVVSEAGGGLNGALLRARLVDELHLVLLPTLIGGRDTPTAFDGSPLRTGDSPTPLRLINTKTTADGVVWLHYEAEPP